MQIIVLKKDLIEKIYEKRLFKKRKEDWTDGRKQYAGNIEKAEVLIEALPYIQRFNRKIIVVKYGGSAMVDEELKQSVIQDVTLLKLVGFKPIIVHGGGKEISKWVAKPEWSRNLSMDFVKPMHLPWKLQKWFLEKSINHWFRW